MLLTLLVYSQDNGRIRGFVSDSTSGEVLPFCNVFIPDIEIGTSTDSRGYYLLNDVPPGNYRIVYSYVGYREKVIDVVVRKNRITELDVELIPTSYQFGTIEKIEQKITDQDKMDLGIERLTLRDLEKLPQNVESDIIRSLKHLPGVASTGDISAKYYVRGGTGDQNLLLLNGISLYNPFHALGLFSVVDAEMVNSIEFYKGDFPAEYGSRISSVMNVVTKDGNKNRFSSTASVSLLTAKLLIEGPFADDGSFIITGRKSHSTAILDKFLTEDDVPVDFYDFSFKGSYANQEFIKNGRFSIFGFFSGDNFDDPKPQSEDFQWRNNLFGIEWVQIYDRPFFSSFRFNYSNFTGKVISDGSDIKPRFNSVTDFTFAAEFTLVFDSKDQLTVGLDFKNIETSLEQANPNTSVIKHEDFSGNYILYSKYQLLRFDEFGIDAGVRMYLSGLSEKGGLSLEPRIKGYWNPFKAFLFKASLGSYRQEIATITDENEVISLFDPWTIYPDYLDATRSINGSAGVEYFFTGSLNMSLEGYYRTITNLVVLNENKIFPIDPPLINGDGEAYGLESRVEYSEDNINLSAAYTLSWAYKTINIVKFHPKYDSRHNVKLNASYLLPDEWRLGVSWSYNSGYPYTPQRGYLDRYELGNFFDGNPANIQYGIYTLLGNKNIKRLPDYHRLDISVSKSFDLGFLEAEVNGSIINVYDRKNLFYFKRDTGERVNMLPFLPTASIKVKL